MQTKKQSKTTATTGKYKLYSAGTDDSGKKPICAFFASEAGCRSGANCKFSHGGESSASNNHNKNGTTAPPRAAREMGTSSESSDGDETSPFVSKKELPYASKAATKVLHASSRAATKDDTSEDEDRDSAVKHDVKLENSYSSLAQPDRKRKNSQVVAKPKTNKKKALNSKDAGGIKVKEEHHEGSSSPSSFSGIESSNCHSRAVFAAK
jgi:hypothetical protein